MTRPNRLVGPTPRTGPRCIRRPSRPTTTRGVPTPATSWRLTAGHAILVSDPRGDARTDRRPRYVFSSTGDDRTTKTARPRETRRRQYSPPADLVHDLHDPLDVILGPAPGLRAHGPRHHATTVGRPARRRRRRHGCGDGCAAGVRRDDGGGCGCGRAQSSAAGAVGRRRRGRATAAVGMVTRTDGLADRKCRDDAGVTVVFRCRVTRRRRPV